MYRADPPARETLADIYGPTYFADRLNSMRGQAYVDYLGDEANHRANAIARLRLIERHQGKGRLLDVGCAAGFFLDEAQHRGWLAEGAELSAEMSDYARSQLGLTVHMVPFDEFECEDSSFDVITMWDYLEHSIDPVGDLERAAALLKPRGVLAVSTGDVASLAARISGRRWHLLTPRHHNFFFTRGSLGAAMKRAGVPPIEMRHMSSRYSLGYLAHKLRTLIDRPLTSRLAASLAGRLAGTVAVPVNLFDIITVVGRRSDFRTLDSSQVQRS
jgi:SAM-dependent methyltransferase